MTDLTNEPDAATFEMLARQAVAALPDMFRTHLADVLFRIEDFADQDALDALGIENKWGLSGLYHGRPLSEKSVWSVMDMPPVIYLYRRPLLMEWHRTGVDLADLVNHVIVHEVAHHFGYSDAEIHAVEASGD